jgi:hypothetical protein
MYETPKLNRVGEADEVILGAVPSGGDFDGNFVAEYLPYEGDGGDGGDGDGDQ